MARSLDLDDIGSKIGKEHGAEWPGENTRQIDDFDVFEHIVALYCLYGDANSSASCAALAMALTRHSGLRLLA
jgi:hypothetical protein